MTTKVLGLPEWTPDLADNVLTEAVNVRAIANGYAPVKAPQAVTAATPFPFKTGGSFISSGGTATLLVSTYYSSAGSSSIYSYDGGSWTGHGTFASTQVDRLAQFGDKVLFATGSVPWVYDLNTPGLNTMTDAPNLIDVAQVRDFVAGITTDNKIQWSQFNNATVWTTGVNQADYQPCLWGAARTIIGGEYGIVITDNAVVRMTYVGVEGGLDIIWQFDEISAEVGVMAPGSVCHVGRLIFFLSERGFEMCDGNEVTPIADEKFNRWFFDTYSRAEIANITAAIDPRRSLVLWAMPGNPGKVIAYNWVLKRATTYELDIQAVFTGYTTGTSIDALDAIYGDLDSIPISLDDPSLQGGNPLLLIADSSNVLNALTGDNLAARFRLQNIEPTPGRRSRIREARLVSDTLDASVTIDARMRDGDAESIVSASTMRSNGKMPIRANGRFNTMVVTIPAATDWSYIRGCELEFEAGDNR